MCEYCVYYSFAVKIMPHSSSVFCSERQRLILSFTGTADVIRRTILNHNILFLSFVNIYIGGRGGRESDFRSN